MYIVTYVSYGNAKYKRFVGNNASIDAFRFANKVNGKVKFYKSK